MTPTQILILLLARTCIAEVGFHVSEKECVLMLQINESNAIRKHWTLKQQTLNYNQYWVTIAHQKARPWIRNLEGKNEPLGWPRNLLWKRHVKKWLSIKEAARKFVYGLRYSVDKHAKLCPAAIDYGATTDIPPPNRMRVRCLGEKTKQRYYKEKRDVKNHI
jgi:hypothetical protein